MVKRKISVKKVRGHYIDITYTTALPIKRGTYVPNYESTRLTTWEAKELVKQLKNILREKNGSI